VIEGHHTVQRVRPREYLTRLAQDDFSLRGRRDAGGGPKEQRHSELSLERLNLPRQRRLRDIEHLRRAPKSASINYLDEVAQSSEFHWLPML
jgi:hypothetical protein